MKSSPVMTFVDFNAGVVRVVPSGDRHSLVPVILDALSRLGCFRWLDSPCVGPNRSTGFPISHRRSEGCGSGNGPERIESEKAVIYNRCACFGGRSSHDRGPPQHHRARRDHDPRCTSIDRRDSSHSRMPICAPRLCARCFRPSRPCPAARRWSLPSRRERRGPKRGLARVLPRRRPRKASRG